MSDVRLCPRCREAYEFIDGHKCSLGPSEVSIHAIVAETSKAFKRDKFFVPCELSQKSVPHVRHPYRRYDGQVLNCDGIWPATVALPGSISSGTLRSEDLIPNFLDILDQIDREEWVKKAVSLPNEMFYSSSGDFQNDLAEYLAELMDALDNAAPEGYRFGTTEGDGSEFGFWEVEDDTVPESNEVCAARGMIEVYSLLTKEQQEVFQEAYEAAGEVLSARDLD